MKLLNVRRTYQNIIRIKEILQVLTKHGFGHIVAQLNLSLYIPKIKSKKNPRNPHYLSAESVPVRLRLVLQELGPTFVKFGQILSSRPDIVPRAVIEELKVLQDNVPPFPKKQLLQIIEKELGGPASEFYSEFREESIASGSIGQAHEARLPDGKKVIVKVKRPGIDKTIIADLAILKFLASLAETYIEELQVFQPVMIMEEFSKTIRRELDFTAEAALTEKFQTLLEPNPNVFAPRVYWDYTTNNLITLEHLSGVNISNHRALKRDKIDLAQVADNLVSSFVEQYFVLGIFHADPHPGNILVRSDGGINLIDFGMVGHLSEELKNHLATTLIALYKNDLETIFEVYADLGVFTDNVNERELKSDILELIDKYLYTPFQYLDFAKVFEDIVCLAREHKVILPRDFVMLGKSLVMIVGTAQELDPSFNLSEVVSPHIKTILKKKFSPTRLSNLLLTHSWSLFSLLQRLPSEIKDLIRRLKGGNIRIAVHHENLERYAMHLGQIANRVSISIILSALLISSSLMAAAKVGPLVHDIPLISLIGFSIAGVLGLLFSFAVMRSGNF